MMDRFRRTQWRLLLDGHFLRPLRDPYNALTVSIFAAYIVLWSAISLSRFFALSATVYDLGVSAESLWLVLHPQGTAFGYLQSFLRNGLIYVLSPAVLLPNVDEFLLILQAVLLATPILLIYKIALMKLENKKVGVLLSLVYFFYFPLAGVNWFDFHFQALFIPLFIAGYFFYIRGSWKATLFCFFLASLVRFPYVSFVILFGLIELFSFWYIRFKRGTLTPWDRKSLRIALYTLMFAGSLFVATFILHGGLAFILSESHVSGSGVSFFHATLSNDIFTFGLIFLPVLFLPFLSKRWVLFLAPAAYLVFFTGAYQYHYPYLFRLQYSSMFIPFVLLGTIDTLGRLPVWMDSITRYVTKFLKASKPVNSLRRSRIARKIVNVFVVCVFISTIVCASFLQPYGPFNNGIIGTFEYQHNTNINTTRFNALTEILRMIPPGDPYVLVQNDMPQAYPRSVPIIPLVSGVFTNFNNITNSDIAMNSYPLLLNGHTIYVKLDYLVGDVYTNLKYTTEPMMSMLNEFYNSGYYGIRAEVDGFILLQRNYKLAMSAYAPFSMWIYPNQPFTVSEDNMAE